MAAAHMNSRGLGFFFSILYNANTYIELEKSTI